MKVSIITAVRNGASLIRSTVRSVNAQTYPNIEHVFVDGASIDGTPDIIQQETSRAYKLISEHDRGIYDAFAKGCKLATGDIIAYLNAGDVYESDSVIRDVVAQFQSSNVDAVFGDAVIVDENDLRKVVRRYRSSRFSPARISYGFMPAHTALFLRSKLYDRFGHYDHSYRIAGDFELVARIFGREPIQYSYVDAVWVRMPRGGASSNGWRSNWIITKEMKRACDVNGIPTSYLRLALRFPIKLTEWLSYKN